MLLLLCFILFVHTLFELDCFYHPLRFIHTIKQQLKINNPSHYLVLIVSAASYCNSKPFCMVPVTEQILSFKTTAWTVHLKSINQFLFIDYEKHTFMKP